MENGEEREYSIGELAEVAGVSTRTIRYYVSEGLLPPPVGAGPGSRYTDAHRRQLEVIGRLKAQYLPLREIRRRLIGRGAPGNAAPASGRVVSANEPPSGPRRDRSPEVDDAPVWHHLLAEPDLASPVPMSARFAEPEHVSSSMPPPPTDEDQPPLRLSPVPSGERTWRRVPISEEAELLITESQYRRHRDKIDWLVQWANRVLDG